MNLPTLSAAMNHSALGYTHTQPRNYSPGFGSRTAPAGLFTGLQRRGSMTENYNGELYENYGDSNLDPCHASTSASASSSTATLGFKSNHMVNASTARRPGYYARPGNKHVGKNDLQFSSPSSSCQIATFRRDLPHADHAPDEEFGIYGLSHHSIEDSDPSEHPALSLSNFASNWQHSQISLEPLSLPISHHHRINDDGIYPNMNLGFSRAGKLGNDLENMGSILSDDEDSSEPTSPENMRPYPPFLHIPPNRWTASPESVDTDLDDPGLDDASETSSLSPPYEDDVELRHRFLEPEEEDGMTNNDRERQQQQQQRYHPLDEYPSPFPLQLYNKNNDEHSSTHPHSKTILSSPLPTLSDSPPTPSLSPSSLSSTSPCSSPSSSPPPLSDFVTDNEAATFELEPLELEPLEPPSPLPPPHFTHDPISHNDSIISHQETNAPRSITSSSLLYTPFYDFRSDDYSSSSEVPCSPSRRRSMALPSLEDENGNDESTCDSLGLQQFNQFGSDSNFSLQDSAQPPKTKSHWLSLPGCDVDDDLIPMDLASKNYVPDASIVVQSTPLIPKNGTRSLLMWEPSPVHTSAFSPSLSLSSSSRFPSLFDLNATPAPPIPRSPSPEDELAELERELALNPHKLAELAPDGAEEEVARLVELRRRQKSLSRRYSRENYTKEERERERERCRELSTLLRLKLKLDERSKGSAEQADSVSTPRRSASFPIPASPTSEPQQSSSTSTLPKRSNSYCTSSPSSKHKITSMAQLVANMVFHRQQEAMKKHSHSPTLTSYSSSSPNSTSQSYSSSASSSPLTHFTSVGSVTSPKQMTMRTPRSPLRQVTLPIDLEMSSELGGVPEGNEGEVETGSLSPLVLTTSPLSCHLRDIAPAPAPATDVC